MSVSYLRLRSSGIAIGENTHNFVLNLVGRGDKNQFAIGSFGLYPSFSNPLSITPWRGRSRITLYLCRDTDFIIRVYY